MKRRRIITSGGTMHAPESAATTPAFPAGAPAWAVTMRKVTTYVAQDFLGGPRPWKSAWAINVQKARGSGALLG